MPTLTAGFSGVCVYATAGFLVLYTDIYIALNNLRPLQRGFCVCVFYSLYSIFTSASTYNHTTMFNYEHGIFSQVYKSELVYMSFRISIYLPKLLCISSAPSIGLIVFAIGLYISVVKQTQFAVGEVNHYLGYLYMFRH